jgi:very-short-patch-repair endonuclease
VEEDLSAQLPDQEQRNRPTIGIVTGQRVDPAKVARSRELRRAMTEAEQLLWQHLRGSRLGGLRFRRQQIIAGFIADFYCHHARLVVEVDGEIHADQGDYDAERDRALATYGLRVLRLTNRDVIDHTDDVLRQIAEACAAP